MVGLFRSNNRMVIFSKTEKKSLSLTKYLLFIFADGGVGGHTNGHTIGLNILKLQPIQLLEAVVSS